MKSFIVAAIIAFVSTVTALPANTLETRATGTVVICKTADFESDCLGIQDFPLNECQQIPEDFKNNVGSFMPIKNTFCRITYTADTCTTHGDAFIYNDNGNDLHSFVDPATGVEQDVGSKLTSFLCQECDGCTSTSA